jgi:hypothetical protein
MIACAVLLTVSWQGYVKQKGWTRARVFCPSAGLNHGVVQVSNRMAGFKDPKAQR